MKCQNCNAEIPDDSVFCPECGTRIGETREQEQAQVDSIPAQPQEQMGENRNQPQGQMEQNPGQWQNQP
ncbi:MAG: zinc-ribbon domain-containing protein, partial [Lachnospiraceae bacterium]